jgi:cell wall-associated NlpC family hydrolase
MQKYRKYLGRQHDYFNTNCITLIADIYQEELQRDDFKKIWDYLEIKEGHPEQKSRWWKIYTLQRLLECTKEYATEVKDITQLQEYDVIMFKSEKSSPLHFGMYIGQNMMIHIEEKSYSRIDMLNQDWREKIYGVYRRKVV